MRKSNCVVIKVDANGARQDPDPPTIVGGVEALYVSADWEGNPSWNTVTLTGFTDMDTDRSIPVTADSQTLRRQEPLTPIELWFPRVTEKETRCKYKIVLSGGHAVEKTIDPVIIIQPWE